MTSAVAIKTPTGREIIVDLRNRKAEIPSANMVGELHPLSFPAPRNALKEWIGLNVTRCIKISGKYVGLTAAEAKKLDDAFWVQKEIEEQELQEIVPGLKLLQSAIEDANQYHFDFSRMMEDENGDGVNPPSQPKSNVPQLAKQYPVAALYVKAQRFVDASNFRKSAAGSKALNLIAKKGAAAIDEANEIMGNWIRA